MSYEGYEEFICPKGHYWAVDASTFLHGAHEERKAALQCPKCQQTAEWECSVDETNGYDEDYPQTFSGPKVEAGFEDEWHHDHYGNKYAVKILLFKPDLTPAVGKRYARDGSGTVIGTYTVDRWKRV